MTAVDLGRLRPRWKYLSLAGVVFQQSIAYRVTTFIQVCLTFLWVVILYYLWGAAYSSRPAIAGYDWAQMRTYIVIAFGLNALVGWRVASGMGQMIRSGDVVLEFVRPVNYCSVQLARTVGGAVTEGIASLIVALTIGLLWLKISPPADVASGALFVVSTALGFVTKALVIFLVSLLMFWTTSGLGLMSSQTAILQILTGTIVPLALMPDWLRITSEILPMRGIVSTPVTLYLGKADAGEAATLIGIQLVWLVVLWVAANLAWRRAFNVIDVQGG